MNIFRFFQNKQKCLDVPTDKREKAHRMLDQIIDEHDTCVSWDKEYSLNKYVKSLKTIYTFKEI